MQELIKRAISAARSLTATQVLRRCLAAVVIVLALLQLFTFEKFPGLLQSIGVAPSCALVLAILLVSLEVLSLPWLLELQTRRAVLRLSAVCAGLMMVALTAVEVTAHLKHAAVIFGTVKLCHAGMITVLIMWGLYLCAFLCTQPRKTTANKNGE